MQTIKKSDNVTDIRPIPMVSPMTGIAIIPDWGMGHPMPRGETCWGYSQSDVVDGYVRTLAQELDSETVRMESIETRRKPGYSDKVRISQASGGFIPLICSCDFYTRERMTNSSVIEFSGEQYKQLAERLSDALREWGRCSSFEHKGCLPVSLTERESFIRIKPFALNGSNAEAYLLRLEQLGITIGRTIGDFFFEKNILRRRR